MMIAAGFPSRYIQGRDVLDKAGKYICNLGKYGLVIGGKTALSVTREKFNRSFNENEVTADYYSFQGECSDRQINAILNYISDKNYEVIIGVGGGRVLDTAKAVAFEKKVPIIIVPTVAASDAPCSSSAGIYDDQGKFVRSLLMSRNPDLILVDTEIIVESPLRLFVSGIGDAVCTWYEADACCKAGVKNRFGGFASYSSIGIAKMCRDITLEYGYQACIAMNAKSVTPAFDKVLEATILMSCVGFENGGLSIAHALPLGFSVLEELKKYYHGEKVAFFTLVQLVLEGRKQSEINQLINFYKQIGLPTSLRCLGVADLSDNQFLVAIRNTFERVPIVYNILPPVTERDILYALKVTDKLGE
ncbi:MAG: glycerol dehydrogenase [Bacillota bacterium]